MSIMQGTSIRELQENQQQKMLNMRYNAMSNAQYEQGHNAAHNSQSAMHNQYYNIHGPDKYPQNVQKDSCINGQCPYVHESNDQTIETLAKDISNSLPSDTIMTGVLDIPDIIEEDVEKAAGFLFNIPTLYVDAIIIVVLFVLLSQPFIRNTIGTYINQINVKDDGTVSFAGILIYGIILASLYSLTKKFLIG